MLEDINSRIAIEQQASWLEREICSSAAEVRILNSEINQIKKKLEVFINNYLEEVSDIIEKSVEVDKKLKEIFPSANNNSIILDDEEINFFYEDAEKAESAREKEIKKLYRKLAKKCHPDTTSDPDSLDIFNILRLAYEKGDLNGLIKIEHALLSKDFKDESEVQKLERLEKEHDEILKEKDKLKITKHSLINSKAYKLQQIYRWHLMCGDDLVSRIKERVEDKIRKNRKFLETV